MDSDHRKGMEIMSINNRGIETDLAGNYHDVLNGPEITPQTPPRPRPTAEPTREGKDAVTGNLTRKERREIKDYVAELAKTNFEGPYSDRANELADKIAENWR